MVRTGATVADACAEYLRYIDQDRQRKPSTLRDYDSIFRNHVLPHLGDDRRSRTSRPSESSAGRRTRSTRSGRLANRTREKTITVFHGVMERARKLHRLPVNPVADVEKPRTASRTEINVFSPEEVMALVRAAESEQDAAIFLTAAFTGLRQGELVALRWRDVDFPGSAIRVRASYTNGHLTSPKSGKVRSVPMAPRSPRPSPPRPARVLHRRRRPRLRRHRRRLPRRLSALQALPSRARASRAPPAPLPRPPPHVRHPRHRRRRHPPRPGVDGPRERPDDHAVPPLRPAPAGRRARRSRLRPRPISSSPDRAAFSRYVLSHPEGASELSRSTDPERTASVVARVAHRSCRRGASPLRLDWPIEFSGERDGSASRLIA